MTTAELSKTLQSSRNDLENQLLMKEAENNHLAAQIQVCHKAKLPTDWILYLFCQDNSVAQFITVTVIQTCVICKICSLYLCGPEDGAKLQLSAARVEVSAGGVAGAEAATRGRQRETECGNYCIVETSGWAGRRVSQATLHSATREGNHWRMW